MIDQQIWPFLKSSIESDIKCALLIVVDGSGSSPGKPGFKMAVNENKEWQGTIGGGKVEFTLFDRAVEMIKTGETKPVVIRQVHNPDAPEDSSGMICSGEQTVLIYPLFKKDMQLLNLIADSINEYKSRFLCITPEEIKLEEGILNWKEYFFEQQSEQQWIYRENIGKPHKVFIFGAGHVCLALSEILAGLDFHITIVDNRPGLDIMRDNKFAHEKIFVDYKKAGEVVPDNELNYLIIMTHSHLGDGDVLKQLIDKKYRYLGMMGSPAKVAELYKQLEAEGIEKEKLRKVNSPIGVKINSRTAKEIAVSIAAELISFKNLK